MSFSRDVFSSLASAQGHSKSFIDDCVLYAENLDHKGLPVIFSTSHLMGILGNPELYTLIHGRKFYYKFYQIKKKSGKGFRQIVTPYSNLKSIQDFIYNEILSKVKVHNAVTGFVPGKSILHNAIAHKGAAAILNIDLLKFFDCIPEKKIYSVFRSLGYATNLAVDLAKLTTVQLPADYLASFNEIEIGKYKKIIAEDEAVLPQGAPTSPTLSNLVLYSMDKRLAALAVKSGVNYSRYADDITFSGKLEQLPKISLIRHIIESEGFNINWDKVRISKKGRRQQVTGLTVSNGIHVPKSFKKSIQNIFIAVKNLACKNI